MDFDCPLEEEPKDYTKRIWVGVVVLVSIMVAALWYIGRPNPNISMVRAKHILIAFSANDAADRARALDLISEIRERLLKGERFETLARRYSDDPGSRARGGDLNFLPKGSFAAEFEQYVWSAPIGQLSDIVATSFGFHLIVVTDRHLTDADRYEMELDERAREALEQRSGTAENPAP